MVSALLGPETSPLTRSCVKLCVDPAVDDPGLEARVRIAEGYHGGHVANIMEAMLTRWIWGQYARRPEPSCMKALALSPISWLDLMFR
jgi:hypothetical protein